MWVVVAPVILTRVEPRVNNGVTTTNEGDTVRTQLGQRVMNPMTNREGTVISQPYIPDNAGMYLVVDVRWDNGNRSTINASKLRPAS